MSIDGEEIRVSCKRSLVHDEKPSVTGDPADPWSYHAQTVFADVPFEILPQAVALVNSPTKADDQLQGTMLIRKLLMSETPALPKAGDTSPCPAVVSSGVVPRLLSFLCEDGGNAFVARQVEAAWAISRICTDDPLVAFEHGAPEVVLRLLHSPCDNVVDCAVWGIVGMLQFAGSVPHEVEEPAKSDGQQSTTIRSHMLRQGLAVRLIRCIHDRLPRRDSSGSSGGGGGGGEALLDSDRSNFNVSIVRNCVWALSSVCSPVSAPDVSFHWVSEAVPLFARFLLDPDPEVVTDACSALAMLSGKTRSVSSWTAAPNRIEHVLNSGALPQLLVLLSSTCLEQSAAMFMAIQSISTHGDPEHTLVLARALSGARSRRERKG